MSGIRVSHCLRYGQFDLDWMTLVLVNFISTLESYNISRITTVHPTAIARLHGFLDWKCQLEWKIMKMGSTM
jgi:hypothetical protein